MSNKQLKKDLANAKARFKAAQKKLTKLESSDDNQAISFAGARSAIAEAQGKVDLEQEIIDDIQKRLQSETNNVTAIVRNEDGSLSEVTNAAINDAVTEDSESSNQTPTNKVPSNSKKRKRDLPQVSFRIEEERYQDLKLHYQHPVSHHLSPFDNLADMTRSLNLADLDCDLFFILKRTNQQLARFLDVAKLNKSELQANQKQMLRNTSIKFHADSDTDKEKLVDKLGQLHQFIESLDLYEFEK